MKILLCLFLAFTSSALAGPLVEVLEPEVLQKLDQPGVFSLATVLGAENAERDYLSRRGGELGLTRLKILRLNGFVESRNGLYKSLLDQITADVSEIKTTSGEKMAYSSEQAEKLAPAGNVARHFDPYFLTSARSAFPLIAVVNRIDRKDFSGACGELRFIYRLAYYRAEKRQNELLESRSTMPLFLNVVYEYSSAGGCESIARSWNSSAAGSPAEKAAWLMAGPLEKSKVKLKQIELNMQIVRFPSGQKTDFGGQAIYLFRIFREQDGSLVSIPLENTPNVGEILKQPALKDALLRQISDRANLEKIDQGIFVLENTNGKLLATRALSFSTSGRARLANKPFTAIFGAGAKDLEKVDLSGLKFLRSRAGLVERLNNQSCIGCHQSSGTAGFHMLGMTGTLNSEFNQVVLPFSPHFYAEHLRRNTYVADLAEGKSPNTFRPLSIQTEADWRSGAPVFAAPKARDLCLPDGKDFVGGGCDKDSECRVNVQNSALGVAIGECIAKKNVTAGHVCREGKVSTASFNPEYGDFHNLKSFRDTIDISKTFAEGCGNPAGGVPLGRISRACESESSAGRLEFVDALAPGKIPPKEMCAMRGGPQFDECAKSPNPPDCLAKAKIARGLLDTCYIGSFCREDYICQRLPEDVSRLYSGATKEKVKARITKLGELGIGFCVPNYFVFNMRADGHIIPETRPKD